MLLLTLLVLQAAPPRVPLAGDWTYVDGREYPGAKGGLEADPAAARAGKPSQKLKADFSGGGAYVGVWRELAGYGKDFQELRVWVKTSTVARVGVRLVDASGQVHQRKGVAIPAGADWKELVLKPSEIAGSEHWDGANDGRWRGPAKAFGLNVGVDSFDGAKAAELWLGGVDVVPGRSLAGRPAALPATLSQPAVRPGSSVKITYRWDAEPLGSDVGAFVHFTGPKGMAFQHDHGIPTPTSTWSGKVEYTKTLIVGDAVAPGEYRIVLGLYDKSGRYTLKSGENHADVGVLKVDPAAPAVTLPAPSLRLQDFKLTWSDEFDGPLDVSPVGPGTRWIAHTPTFTDFGDARFVDPKGDVPFKIENGILRIEAAKDEKGKWRGGLLSSVDTKGNGFAQKYGYFECRMKFPKGPGVWPAFWLLGVPHVKDRKIQQAEVDIVEFYGVGPKILHMTLHLWGPDKFHWGEGEPAVVEGMTDDFHTYGALVEEKEIVWYFDGIELWRQPTPESAKVPLYVLINLALGGGWPIDKTPDPSHLYVDYVRVYARK